MCYVIAQSKRKVSGNLIIENWAEIGLKLG